jgi:PKD repeat protein
MFLNRGVPTFIPVRFLVATSVLLLAVAILVAPGQVSASGGCWCTAPYCQVQGPGSTPAVDPTGELTIEGVYIGEPFDGNCADKSLTFVIRVITMDPGHTGQVTPLPNTRWLAQFVIPGTANSSGLPQTLFVSWDTKTIPTGAFNWGIVGNGPGGYTSQCLEAPGQPCAATGTVTPDGTITITLDTTHTLSPTITPFGTVAFIVPPIPPGVQLTSIQGITFICACVAGNGLLEESQTIGDGTYITHGNVSCSAPPVAALSASPTSGSAPLTVNFDASGSNIPAGGCGTINSYIFDFGDASQVTQATSTISHTYNSAGTYPARVRVTNTVGLTSSNVAEAVISVGCFGPCPPPLVVSRITHSGVGDFDVVLPQPPATRGVECRSNSGNYKLVFGFTNNLTSVASASVTSHDPVSGTGTVLSGSLGPNPNQYTVNLTGVSDAQYITVTLTGVLDSTGALGDEIATMGVLVGDVNASGRVSSGDTNLCKAQALQPVTAANFRNDVNASGAITTGDVNIIKQNALHQLPSPP